MPDRDGHGPHDHDHGPHPHAHRPRTAPPHPDPFLPAKEGPRSAAMAAPASGDKPAHTASHGHGHAHGGRGHDHAQEAPPPEPDPSVPAQHKAKAPKWVRVWVVTCSDTRTKETDEGGRILRARLADAGHVHAGSAIVKDDAAELLAQLERAREAGAQAVLVTGGTGLTSRDATFEALQAVIARPIPGFGELFRMLSFNVIGSAAMLSRATAGVTMEGLVVFAMPGSPAAVRLACDKLILPELGHLMEQLSR